MADNFWAIDTGYKGVSATLYWNNFVNNQAPVAAIFYVNTVDYFDNGTVGNYWSNYNGTDTNGDGIGDSPYAFDSYRSDRYPLISPFNIDSINVSIPEWINNLPTPQPLQPLPLFPTPTPTATHSIATPTSAIAESPATTTPSPTVPEFQTWQFLPLLFTGALIAALFRKRKFI